MTIILVVANISVESMLRVLSVVGRSRVYSSSCSALKRQLKAEKKAKEKAEKLAANPVSTVSGVSFK